MDNREITWLRAYLGKDAEPCYYFKDRYALLLLSHLIDGEITIGELKKTKWGYLLNKPVLKQITSNLSGNKISTNDLLSYWSREFYVFKRQFGVWGAWNKNRKNSYYQTSRPGLNLVLQLNFSHQHDVPFYKYLGKYAADFFKIYSHPIANSGLNTLGWARLDVDLEHGELLIEEIQNDWLREAKEYFEQLKNRENSNTDTLYFLGDGKRPVDFERYYKQVLLPYFQIWDEALLTAVIEFASNDLGISRLFYHTFETGNQIKGIGWRKPPRSLYTKLPKRFGFELTDIAPKALRENRYLKRFFHKVKDAKWYQLDLEKAAI